MSIKIITGKPGSGKTYYAVHHLANNYCDKKTCKLLDDKVTIITNIDSLQLPHLNLEHCFRESKKGPAQFFTEEYQKIIQKKYPKVIYFIDEAQQYFDSKFYDKKTFYYFQTHRHLGHDIYLITQSFKLLPYNINELSEREIRAQPRSVSVFGEFKYYVFVSGTSVDRFALKKNKKIFDLYKSMDQKELEKVKNPFIKYLGILLIFMIGAGFLFHHTFIKKINSVKNPQKNKPETNIQGAAYASTHSAITPKIKKYSNNEKNHRIIIDSIIVSGTTYYYDVELNVMLPISDAPFPIQITKRGKAFKLIATVPHYYYQLIQTAKTKGESVSQIHQDNKPRITSTFPNSN